MAAAWDVRNGRDKDSPARFITREEVGALATETVVRVLTGASADVIAGVGQTPPEHQAVLDAITDIVTSSKVYEFLRKPIERIQPRRQLIDDFTGDLEDILERIDELTAGLAATDAAVATEVTERISGDESLASLITTVAATADGAVALVASEETARIAADSALASSLSIVSTSASNALSLVAAETTARIDGDAALATSLSTVSSSVGSAHSLIAAETSARTSADTAITTSLGVQVSRIDAAEAAITSEQTTRSNKDNSLAQALNTIWASIGGSSALIQDGALAAVSPAAVSASKWLQVQAAVTDPNTGQVNAASIKQELLTYANSVNSTLNTTWAIRSNVDGIISGVSLMTTSGAGSTPGTVTSHFMVMADRFSLVNPSNTAQRPVAFSVDADGNAVFAGRMSADSLYGGSIRGINVNAGSFVTRGSYLTSACAGGATTLNVKDTSDFPASGSGWIMDTNTFTVEGVVGDRDAFSWTGKTATTLTGVTGVLSHPSGVTVIPQGQAMAIDARTNQMRYWGDRGDGFYDELASIGQPDVASFNAILLVGNTSSGYTRTAIMARANNTTAIRGVNQSTNAPTMALSNNLGTCLQLVGSSNLLGILQSVNLNGSAPAITGVGQGTGLGGFFQGNATRAGIRIENSLDGAWPASRERGQITFGWRYYQDDYVSYSAWVPAYSDGANWRYFDGTVAA
ncbi:DUF1983 domain-containing protein [Piscinibacter gummiphilus]|uniref:DUF1983 domain-containing protein n=1 Tax=Piscinibacter gummiphilus TaxID=946333 RepID=A0ABZ0CNK3_9BURK|nr:DUF1983 domain-containing protein [Piscinibacter gummiphilus]WOB06459.1 DUF1983 domain-containing protein [Piscinibacter gummiphilus]